MALADKIPAITEHISRYTSTLEFNKRLFCILEGQLREEVVDSLRNEMVSQPAFNRAIQRIPAINIHKKATQKLSQIYTDTVVRDAEVSGDQELLKHLEKTTCANNTLLAAQTLYNSQYMCAIEPFVEDGMVKSRVLPGHTFLPYSDDPNNPMKLTVFIKFLPPEFETVVQTKDNGEEHKPSVRQINMFALYSDDEFLIIEEGGAIRDDKMRQLGATSKKNPFGRIPFVYINRSEFQLIPFVNQEALDISVLIPKLLTDLNYAVQFQSHSLIWAKNTNLTGAEINPDTLINLGERESPDHGDPEIGVIKPEVDIEHILQLTQFQVSAYMATIGIKTTNIGSMMPGREPSGISKLIDEGDVSNEQKRQAQEFKKIEVEYWKLMDVSQRYFAGIGELEEKRQFSDSFIDDFSVRYSEAKAFKSDMDKIKEARELRDGKLATQKQAIKRIDPDATEKQLKEYVTELNNERDEETERMLNIAGRTEDAGGNDGGDPSDGDN